MADGKGRIWRWRTDERGAFSVYAAIAFPVFLALLGFGLDYWTTVSFKTRLDAASDTAALAGAKAATEYLQTNGANQNGESLIAAAKQAGSAAAAQSFKANAGTALTANPVTPTISVAYQSRAFTAVVSYSTTRATGFAGLLGLNSMALTGSATATQRQTTYINVYVLVDASQSMGIAANAAQMAALYRATAPYNADGAGVGCVFGCHVAMGTSDTLENIAHANGIQLRIDVARAAIHDMAQSAQANADVGNIKFAVYQMQQNPSNGAMLTQVYPNSGLTNNYSALATAMGPTSYVLDLGPNNSGGTGDSNQTSSLATFAATLPAQGDGSSAGSPLNYVYVVTDGAMDVPGGCGYGHCTQVVPSSACDAIKSAGATVGVIYTTYVSIYTRNDPNRGLDARFRDLVQPFVGMIPGNLQSCASGAGWYYEASDDMSLLAAMSNLFASTLTQVRLTN